SRLEMQPSAADGSWDSLRFLELRGAVLVLAHQLFLVEGSHFHRVRLVPQSDLQMLFLQLVLERACFLLPVASSADDQLAVLLEVEPCALRDTGRGLRQLPLTKKVFEFGISRQHEGGKEECEGERNTAKTKHMTLRRDSVIISFRPGGFKQNQRGKIL